MGCNIQLDARSNRIGRFSPGKSPRSRRLLCDMGRYSFPFQRTGQDRPQSDANGTLEQVTYDEVIAFTGRRAAAGGCHVDWLRPHGASNEELFLFQRLFARCSRRRPGSPKRGPRGCGAG